MLIGIVQFRVKCVQSCFPSPPPLMYQLSHSMGLHLQRRRQRLQPRTTESLDGTPLAAPSPAPPAADTRRWCCQKPPQQGSSRRRAAAVLPGAGICWRLRQGSGRTAAWHQLQLTPKGQSHSVRSWHTPGHPWPSLHSRGIKGSAGNVLGRHWRGQAPFARFLALRLGTAGLAQQGPCHSRQLIASQSCGKTLNVAVTGDAATATAKLPNSGSMQVSKSTLMQGCDCEQAMNDGEQWRTWGLAAAAAPQCRYRKP